MVTLREVLKQAETESVAIGHFNVSDWVTLKAVFASASERNVPVIVGVSESERHFLGVRQIADRAPACCQTEGASHGLVILYMPSNAPAGVNYFGEVSHSVQTAAVIGSTLFDQGGAVAEDGNVTRRAVPALCRGKK